MKKKELEYVVDCILNNGMEYTFRDYSSFKEIKDEKFHQLREKYLEATAALENISKSIKISIYL